MSDKVLLKPTAKRHFTIQANPIELTYINGTAYVEAEKHYDKHGTFNGYLVPYAAGKYFIWDDPESLKIAGLALTGLSVG